MTNYIKVKFQRKPLTLQEVDKYSFGSNPEKCKVMKSIKLTEQEYNEIGNDLLDDRDIWENIGGIHEIREGTFEELKQITHVLSAIDEMIGFKKGFFIRSESKLDASQHPEVQKRLKNDCCTLVVEVIADNKEPFYVNTEGYDYARYVGRAVEAN